MNELAQRSLMLTLAAPAAPSEPHPQYLAWVREFAVAFVAGGFPLSHLSVFNDKDDAERERITAEVLALKARGIGPERAAKLLSHADAGRDLRVIPGGGESTEKASRPRLRLVLGGAA